MKRLFPTLLALLLQTQPVVPQGFLINPHVLTPALPSLTTAVTNGPIGSLRNNYSGWVGFKFSLSSSVTVYQLARYAKAANTGTHKVAIFNTSGTKLAEVSIDCAPPTSDQFVWGTLGSPLSLSSGTSYIIASEETSGGDQWHDSAGGYTSASPVSMLTLRYGSTTWPDTESGTTGQTYVPVNFRFN